MEQQKRLLLFDRPHPFAILQLSYLSEEKKLTAGGPTLAVLLSEFEQTLHEKLEAPAD